MPLKPARTTLEEIPTNKEVKRILTISSKEWKDLVERFKVVFLSNVKALKD